MKKGFTLIELLAVIVILAIVALISTPLILNVIDDAKKGSFKSTAYGIIEAAELNYALDLNEQIKENIIYTYENGEQATPENKTLEFKGSKPQNGEVRVNSEGKVALAIHDGTYCAEKGYYISEVEISKKQLNECEIPHYSDNSGANQPLLAPGMIPIIWNGSDWEEVDEADKWYDYDAKWWANVQTEDGSMWVWIPRYIYKIFSDTTSGWHTNDAVTIDVQFTKGIDDNRNSDVIGNIDTGTTAEASKNKWTDHPAFWWDNDNDEVREENEELTGIWVMKFEPNVEGTSCYVSFAVDESYNSELCDLTTLEPESKPNKYSWRAATPNNYFTVGINLEKNSKYGWDGSGDGIDTHMIKNIERGAIAYLSNSKYGKNAEIWNNVAWPWHTGCAGEKNGDSMGYQCENTYETSKGQEASTTGNIYGIYDMSGGSYELVSAYLVDDPTNPDSELINSGESVVIADNKYKDLYQYGNPNNRANNYNLTINHKGDAIYETSNSSNNWSGAWYEDAAVMAKLGDPWFFRGGERGDEDSNGIFYFLGSDGHYDDGFWQTTRYTIIVGEGY